MTCYTNTDRNIIPWKYLGNDHNRPLSLKPFPNLELLVNQFSYATPENINEPRYYFSSEYYDTGKMHNTEIPHKTKLLSLFHVNLCSLNKTFDGV